MNSQPSVPPQKNGFTLIEVVIAVAIMGFVLASIFKIADGAIRSTSAMVEIQNDEITKDAFFSFLRDHFDRLPGNAVLDLQELSTSEPFQSAMTFQNTPIAFQWGGVPISAQATRLVTVPTITNGLDVVLEFYDLPILDSDEGPAERGIYPIASITLLNDVRLFEWTVLDGRQYANTERNEWPYEWNDPNRRPTYVELTIVFSNDQPAVKRLFWLPNKANPRTTMGALQNNARSTRAQGGGGDGGGQGGGRPGPSGDQENRPPQIQPQIPQR